MAAEADTDDTWARSTAPQSPYTTREIGIGVVVLLVGLAVAFAIPILLA